MGNVGEWQQKIMDTFSVDGVNGAAILPLLEEEIRYKEKASEFYGHRVLADAFYSFFYETLLLTEKIRKDAPQTAETAQWLYMCLHYASIFKSFRASDILFLGLS